MNFSIGPGLLDHDTIELNRAMILSPCFAMIFSENRFPFS